MQTKNNYQLEWEIATKYGLVVDKGIGVFNGDIGIVTAIHTYDETVEVEFDEKRKVKYPFKLLDELELAYAVTIHKSQEVSIRRLLFRFSRDQNSFIAGIYCIRQLQEQKMCYTCRKRYCFSGNDSKC